MTRASIAGAMVLLAVLAQPAAAAMNCGSMLDTHAAAITKMSHVSAERRAAMHRMALSGYDHCMAGDEFNARRLFEMLEKAGRGGPG